MMQWRDPPGKTDAESVPTEGEWASNEGGRVHGSEEREIPYVGIGERPPAKEVWSLLLNLRGTSHANVKYCVCVHALVHASTSKQVHSPPPRSYLHGG